ncbi:MAG: NADPH-dependent FMN reductase [Planctomycetota bacterium]
MPQKIRVVAISGSLHPDSKTTRALRVAAAGAADAGAEVDLVDLREHRLPILNSPHAPAGAAAEVERLQARFRAADALLIASPEYHGSFSGALKNAFDLMGFDEFEGKMAALVGVAGGALGATNTLNHLRVVCRQLHAWVLPDQCSVADASAAFDAAGAPTDPAAAERLRGLGVQLVKFATLHREAGTNPFVRLWEQRIQNPGG